MFRPSMRQRSLFGIEGKEAALALSPSGHGIDPLVVTIAISSTWHFHHATRIVEIRGRAAPARPSLFSFVRSTHPSIDPRPSPTKSKQAMAPRPSSHHRATAFALLCLCSVSSSTNGELIDVCGQGEGAMRRFRFGRFYFQPSVPTAAVPPPRPPSSLPHFFSLSP